MVFQYREFIDRKKAVSSRAESVPTASRNKKVLLFFFLIKKKVKKIIKQLTALLLNIQIAIFFSVTN